MTLQAESACVCVHGHAAICVAKINPLCCQLSFFGIIYFRLFVLLVPLCCPLGLVKLKPVKNQYKPWETLQGKCYSLGKEGRKIGKQKSFYWQLSACRHVVCYSVDICSSENTENISCYHSGNLKYRGSDGKGGLSIGGSYICIFLHKTLSLYNCRLLLKTHHRTLQRFCYQNHPRNVR